MTLRRDAETSESASVGAAIGALAVAMVGLTLVESLLAYSSRSLPLSMSHGVPQNQGFWLLSLVAALTVWIASPLRGRAILAVGVAVAFMVGTMANFRGVWCWRGTFDHYTMSRWPWLGAIGLGLVLGVVLVWRSPRSAPRLEAGLSVATLAAATLWTLLEGVLFKEGSSVFAHTRSLGLGAAAITAAALAWLGRDL